jgi:S-adenosylmethionine hydrolase
LAGGAGRAVELNDTRWHLPSPGATFAGRDVFAPVAAQLCNGIDLGELGDAIDADLLLPGVVALPQSDDDTVIAQVLWVDRYGNAQLNVGPDDLPDGFGPVIDIRCSSPTDPTGCVRRSASRATSYAELAGGAVGLVLDSSGLLAVSMDQRSAAEELGLDVGDQVTLTANRDDGITQPVTLRRQR